MEPEESVVEMNGLDEDVTRLAQRITRHVNSLSDPNRATRKRGLEGIRTELFTGNTYSNSVVVATFKSVHASLVNSFSDPVEKCRELAISVVQQYIETTSDFEMLLPVLVPCLLQRLGQLEIVEQSEELRLQLSELMTGLVALSNKLNGLYLDDYIKILQRTLVDPFFEVRKEACKCASLLARAVPQHFHLQSESLIKPLLYSISHQHSKVRVAVINTIGKYLLQSL